MDSFSNSAFYANPWLYISYLSGFFNQPIPFIPTQNSQKIDIQKCQTKLITQILPSEASQHKKLQNIVIQQKEKNSNIQQKIKLQEHQQNIVQEVQQSQSQFQIVNKKSSKSKRYKLQKVKGQKENRNRNSNIIRSFFKFLHLKLKQIDFIRKIIISTSLDVDEKNFIQWVKSNQPDFRNYIRNSSMKNMLVKNIVYPDYNCLMRVLFYHFLRCEYKMILLNSNKMTWQSALTHLQGSRQILNDLLDY